VSAPFLNRRVTVRQGAYLPHWTADNAIYHTVFRLEDSLPTNVVERHRAEQEALLPDVTKPPSVTSHDRLRLFSSRIDGYLDAGRGECWLAQSQLARSRLGGHFAISTVRDIDSMRSA
jgi:hypothetical protein